MNYFERMIKADLYVEIATHIVTALVTVFALVAIAIEGSGAWMLFPLVIVGPFSSIWMHKIVAERRVAWTRQSRRLKEREQGLG